MSRILVFALLWASTTQGFGLAEAGGAEGEQAKKKIVFVAGRPSHGYGSHEHNAGCLLLAKYLREALPNVDCEVYRNGWPSEGMAAFEGADAVVVYCDGGGGHLLNRHLEEFDNLMDQGVGLVCIHYAVEVPAGKPGDAFLEWLGGYFEIDWSVNPHWTASFRDLPDHPIARGVKPFEINDEWYFHMRFRDGMRGVTPILSAHPPASTMSRADGTHSGNPHVRQAVANGEIQHVAWASERPGGGRGFGFTGGHYHWNWGDDNFRKLMLNAIVWAAHGEVPEEGVTTATPAREDLEANQDEPKPSEKEQGQQQGSARPKSVPRVFPRPAVTIPVAAARQDTSHDPAHAVANLDVHEQLQVGLFAFEPQLLSPANIDVDHRGRVWVCEIVNYRAHRDRRPEGDRILILEDTDGDGQADSQKVFYQGRDIDSPHGVCVLGNRVIVSAASKVVVFTDVDGDDRPDKKEDLFTGVSGVQHDHGIHAFVFGPDGKLYFNFGNEGKQLLDSQGQPVVDTAGNVVRADRKPYQQGMVFRCNLEGSELETLGWNFRNNWMATVDSFGTLWQSDNDDDGNRGVRINYVMEFGNYGYCDEMTGASWRTRRTGMEPALPEQHWHQNDPGVVPNLLHTGAGSPTGITVYEGDQLPDIFQGQLLHCDAGPSVTRAYRTSDEGAGYRAQIVNMLEGTRDPWFRPSDVKVAPDGSLIVADWYDPGVGGHAMGDLDRGRLFRVTRKGAGSRYTVPTFDFDTAAGAVEALKNPNYAARYLAWTALRGMGVEAEGELLKLLASDNPRLRARALWLLGNIAGREQHYVDTASKDDDPNIRIVAVRLARQLASVDVIPVVARLVDDPSPQVRREVVIALRHHESQQAPQLWAELAARHDGQDRWYLEALGIGADRQWDSFLAAWLERVGDAWNTPAGRDILWRSRAGLTPVYLAKIINDPRTSAAELPRYFRAFDFLHGGAKDQAIAEIVFRPASDDEARRAVISVEATRRVRPDKVTSDSRYQDQLRRTLDSLRNSPAFIDLVGHFDVQERYAELLALAQQDADGQLGVQAARTLLGKRQTELFEASLNGADVALAAKTVAVLGNSAENSAVRLLRPLVGDKKAPLELRRQSVRALAKIIPAGAGWLLRQIEAQQLDEELQHAAAAELTRSFVPNVREKALELFPLPSDKGNITLPPIGELIKQRGDAARGKVVFDTTGTCAKCHIVNGQGKEVGPDLSEIGTKLSREAMFESVLYPNAGISHNYETYAAVMEDGNVVTGLLTSQTDDEVTITSQDGIARTIKRAALEELAKQPISLMPADLLKVLTQEELVDAVEYLTTLKAKPL